MLGTLIKDISMKQVKITLTMIDKIWLTANSDVSDIM